MIMIMINDSEILIMILMKMINNCVMMYDINNDNINDDNDDV